MSKKKNLAEALQKENIKPKKSIRQKTTDTETNNLPPSRQGKKGLTVFFYPDVIKQLKLIGIEEDLTNQDMVQEALNDYFVKHGKAQIA